MAAETLEVEKQAEEVKAVQVRVVPYNHTAKLGGKIVLGYSW